MITEESGFLLKTYVWYFRFDYRQLWRLYPSDLTGENYPPHTRFGALPCIAVSEESWNQGLMPLSPALLLCIIFFSSSGAFHLGVSIRTLGRGLSQKPLLTSSYWREEANLKTLFSTLTHYSALFPLLALPCYPLPPRFVKLQLQKASTQGSLAMRQHLHLSSTTWPSVWGGRWRCGE